jgi:HAE1 family hydrophobic/amphiphilic exporter-1
MQNGQMSVFTRQFSVPVSVSLGASLVLALTIIPLAVSRFKPYANSPLSRLRRRLGHTLENADRPEGTRAASRFRPLIWMRDSYVWLLRQTLQRRLAAVLLLAGFVVLTIKVPWHHTQFQAIPSADTRTVSIDMEFAPNYNLAKADKVFDAVEGLLNERRDALGIKRVFKNYTAEGGELQLYLLNEDDHVDYPYSTEEVRDILWDLLPEQAPGAQIFVAVGGQDAQRGGGGQSKVSVRMEGDDMASLDRYAMRFMAILEGMPELTSVRKSTEGANQEIQLKIDSTLADTAGLDPTQIAQTVAFALMGAPLTEVKQGGREIKVKARFQAKDRRSAADLDNVMMRGRTGAMVSLAQLVSKQHSQTPQTIQRRNGKNFVWITAMTAGKDLSHARDVVQNAIDQFDLPLGYTIAFGDELQNLQEDASNFASLLLLAVVLIFVVMSALFESCLLPLSIMTSVPLAFLGVGWMMFLTGTPMDTIAFIGCILMVGVVVNNGIVIVDHINHLRKHENLERFDAIMQAGRDRLRPVLMTAITTILGAAPLIAPIFVEGFGEPATVSLGCAMIGGLITGTFLTLLVVPLMYSFIDDLQVWLGRFIAAIAGLRGRKQGSAASAQP